MVLYPLQLSQVPESQSNDLPYMSFIACGLPHCSCMKPGIQSTGSAHRRKPTLPIWRVTKGGPGTTPKLKLCKLDNNGPSSSGRCCRKKEKVLRQPSHSLSNSSCSDRARRMVTCSTPRCASLLFPHPTLNSFEFIFCHPVTACEVS